MDVNVHAVAAERAVVVDGLRLYARRRPGPARPPLLLLHGIGGSLDSWAPLLTELADRDIVMIDCPGAGRSDIPPRPIRMPAIADYVAGAIRELGIVRTLGLERLDVLGYSLGGLVAQELAHRHPGLVRRLILAGTIMGIWARPTGWKVTRALLSTKRYSDPARAERDIPLLAGGRTARDPAVLAAILAARDSHPPSPRGYRYQQWAATGWTSYRWLSSLRKPTLVLHGAKDPVVHVANARLLAARIPNSELAIIPGAGHMLLFDEPEKAAPVIERFLGGS